MKAAVTIHLEEGKIEAARDAVTEFEEITRELTAPAIEAETSAVRGALALSEKRAELSARLEAGIDRLVCLGADALFLEFLLDHLM